MDFFEALKERVAEKLHSPYATFEDLDPKNHKYINATIEALKETMVGEPRRYVIIGPGRATLKTNEFIGTDGEEVVVMVFKKP